MAPGPVSGCPVPSPRRRAMTTQWDRTRIDRTFHRTVDLHIACSVSQSVSCCHSSQMPRPIPSLQPTHSTPLHPIPFHSITRTTHRTPRTMPRTPHTIHQSPDTAHRTPHTTHHPRQPHPPHQSPDSTQHALHTRQHTPRHHVPPDTHTTLPHHQTPHSTHYTPHTTHHTPHTTPPCTARHVRRHLAVNVERFSAAHEGRCFARCCGGWWAENGTGRHFTRSDDSAAASGSSVISSQSPAGLSECHSAVSAMLGREGAVIGEWTHGALASSWGQP